MPSDDPVYVVRSDGNVDRRPPPVATAPRPGGPSRSEPAREAPLLRGRAAVGRRRPRSSRPRWQRAAGVLQVARRSTDCSVADLARACPRRRVDLAARSIALRGSRSRRRGRVKRREGAWTVSRSSPYVVATCGPRRSRRRCSRGRPRAAIRSARASAKPAQLDCGRSSRGRRWFGHDVPVRLGVRCRSSTLSRSREAGAPAFLLGQPGSRKSSCRFADLDSSEALYARTRRVIGFPSRYDEYGFPDSGAEGIATSSMRKSTMAQR